MQTKPLEEQSAQGANSENSASNRHKTIRVSGFCKSYPARFLIDSGATHNFVSLDYLRAHELDKLLYNDDEGSVTFGNDTTVESSAYVNLPIQLGDKYTTVIRAFTGIKSSKHDIILGKPWHFDECPHIDWRTNEVTVGDVTLHTSNTNPYLVKPEVQFISRREFNRMCKNDELEAYAIVLKNCEEATLHDKAINSKHDINEQTYLATTTSLEVEEAAKNTKNSDALVTILDSFADVFPDELPPGLPPKRHVDHTVPLEPDAKIPAKKLYRLSSYELKELKKQLNELMEKGWIKPSKSPYGAPVLFVAKKEGTLRMVIDYRSLNSITIKDKYPLPRTEELFEQLKGAKIFSKIDLRSGYHQIRVAPEDTPKTAILTHYGAYEFLVLPFGMTSSPSTFMRLMNDIYHDMLDSGVIIFLDDILVYGPDQETHDKVLQEVLSRLRKHKLYAKKEKCEFGVKRLEFLGHIIDQDGLHTEPSKVKAVMEWPPLQSTKDIQCFLGLANYYHRFINGYSSIVQPLTRLLRKDVQWQWTNMEQEAFDNLKQALSSAPVLALPDPDKRFYVHTDASSTVAIGGILSQMQDDGKLHPVAYTSRGLTTAETRFTVYELEMLSLKHCLTKWRHLLDMQKFTIFTDNRALSSLMTNTNLNKRQIHWLELFMTFSWDIHHIPRERNHGADALSKRPPTEPSNPDMQKELQTVLRVQQDDSRRQDAISHYEKDDFTKNLKDRIRSGLEVQHFEIGEDKALYRQLPDRDKQLVIPRMPNILLSILKDSHDHPSAGHRGVDATMERIERRYYWPNIAKSVRQYIKTCDSCQRNKATNQKSAGLIQPLPPAGDRWESISMDYITQLPKTKNGYDAITVIVDRLTKRAHFVPCHTTDSAEDIAHLFLREVYRHHGLPKEIVSDRDTKHTSKFWSTLMSLLKVSRSMSSAYHPESDGQTEKTNRTLEDLLRHYVAYDQKDWDMWLPIVEHTYNNTHHASIKMTPYYCDLGRNISSAIEPSQGSVTNEAADQLHKRLIEIKTRAIEGIKAAAEHQQQYANKTRRDLEFTVGQEVLVDQRHINPHNYPTSAKKKLANKFAGPYKIIKRIGQVAYQVELPPNIKAHNVFHIRVLKLYNKPDEPERQPPRPEPLIVNDEEEYEVEILLDKRTRHRRTEYLVKWLGYPVHESTWEPIKHLKNSQQFINDYERRQTATQAASTSTDKDSKKPSRQKRRTTEPGAGNENNGGVTTRSSSSRRRPPTTPSAI